MFMRRRWLLVFVVVAAVAIVPRAWGQFLSDEERKGMFAVSLEYSTRDIDLDYRGTSVPVEDMDAIFEQFAASESLDSVELTVAWLSFGYIELRGTLGLVDYELSNVHATDSTYDTVLSGSSDVIYGVSAVVRYRLNDWWLTALEVGFMTGKFDDLEGDISQLDVVWYLSSSLVDIEWREVAVSSLMLFEVGNVLPYAGVRYVDTTTKMKTILTLTPTGETYDRINTYGNSNAVSAVVGLKWRITPLVVFDVEAQLVNNDRVTAGITLTF
jgi:hypothetical protein